MKSLPAKESCLILLDLIMAGMAQILAIISALKYDSGNTVLFWRFAVTSILCGTICGVISWWAWAKLRFRE